MEKVYIICVDGRLIFTIMCVNSCVYWMRPGFVTAPYCGFENIVKRIENREINKFEIMQHISYMRIAGKGIFSRSLPQLRCLTWKTNSALRIAEIDFQCAFSSAPPNHYHLLYLHEVRSHLESYGRSAWTWYRHHRKVQT